MKPGYKQTELGVIPEEWRVVPFGVVFSRLNAKEHQIQRSAYQETGVFPVVDQGQTAVVGFSDRAEKVFRRPEDGVVVFGDHTCVVKFVDFDFVVGADGTQILVAQPGHSARFHAFALQRQGIHSTGYNRHFKFLKERAFISPDFPEQRAIAKALSDVDALLAGLDRLIAKKRDLKQAAMHQLLTGQTRLPGFRGEWAETPLGDLGLFLKGSGVTRDQTRSGSLACVRYGELYTHHNDVIRDFYSWLSPEVASTAVRLRKGDILFAGSGETKEEIGKCAAFVSDGDAYAGGDIVILRPRDANAVFLGYFLNTAPINRQKASRGQGDAVVHIGSSALAAIRCRLPEPVEQTAIAEVLTDMAAELASLEQRREKTRALKQAMMRELLTGKTRLVAPELADA